MLCYFSPRGAFRGDIEAGSERQGLQTGESHLSPPGLKHWNGDGSGVLQETYVLLGCDLGLSKQTDPGSKRPHKQPAMQPVPTASGSANSQCMSGLVGS